MVQCSKSTKSENSFASQIPLTCTTALKITIDHNIELKSVYFTVKIHGMFTSLTTPHGFPLAMTISSFRCAGCTFRPTVSLIYIMNL